MHLHVNLPLDEASVRSLRVGQRVLLSGAIHTARDAAHQRMLALLNDGDPLPFDLQGGALFYAGPSATPPGQVIGAIGPTTSGRMDSSTPRVLASTGVRCLIGKGPRSPEVVSALQKYGAVYLAAVGGVAALLQRCIRSSTIVWAEDLGTEAVRRLEVQDFPAIVAIDSHGGNLYQASPESG